MKALFSPTGLILAGGLSRRMQGQEKALITLAGRPLLAHVLDRLTPQVTDVVINANGDAGRFASFGRRVIADHRPGFCGPLAGIEAALLALEETDYLLSVPIDTPFLPLDLAERLCAVAQAKGDTKPVVVQGGERVHPVMALWPKAVLPRISAALDARRFKLQDWFRQTPHHMLPIREEDLLFNINTQDDLRQAEEWLARQPL